MKSWPLLLLLILPLVFGSCTDTREEVEIKKDGSGTLVMKSDLGKMLEMMKSFASEDDIKKEGMEKAFDTTMLMKDYIDTASDVPAEKKALLREGKMHLALDVKQNQGKFEMQFPFKSADQLQKLYESLNQSTGGLKSLLGEMGNNSQMQQEGGDKGMPQITAVYDIKVKPGSYSRKVNKERYQHFSESIKLDQLKQMAGMLGKMSYTLVLKLSKPIKKISNNSAVLSKDKKTATLTVDMMEALEHPELLELEVNY